MEKRNRVTKNAICGIGSFDGVHRGHQKIITYLKKRVHRNQKTGIITFSPLPYFVLKSHSIRYLTPREEKEKIFKALGIDFIYYFRFTRDFSNLQPVQFVDLIGKEISPEMIVVGENFHFGKGRMGTAHFLAETAKNMFSVKIIHSYKDEGIISSTRIRELLLLGHIKAANKLFGRKYSISGMIIRGKGKGKRIGFPTINIRVRKDKLLPLDGVYKVNVIVHNREFLGAMFCRHHLVEVYLVEFSGNLYKKKVTVKVLKRIRDIEEFPDDDTLCAAIAADVRKVKK